MSDKEKDEEKPVVAKTAVDLQRLKLMKLMKNIVKYLYFLFKLNLTVSDFVFH